jgi:hypothetical protein
MSAPTPSIREVIHALLDMVVSLDDDATEEQNDLATATAFERLNEIGALTVTVDDETGEFHANVTPLLTAVGVLIDSPVTLLARQLEADRLAVINTIREHFDKVFSE